MPKYTLHRSRTGNNIRLEISDYSFGFTPTEWQLFVATAQDFIPNTAETDEQDAPTDDEGGDPSVTTQRNPEEVEAEIQELTRRCQQEGGTFDECQRRAIDIVRQKEGQAPTTDRLRAGVDIQSGR